MFKVHPLTALINLFILVMSLLLLKNSIFIYFIALAIVFAKRKVKNKNYCIILYGTFVLSVINIPVGSLNTVIKVLFLVIYVIEGCSNYTQKELIAALDTIFSSPNTCMIYIIKLIYMMEQIGKDYHLLTEIDNIVGKKKTVFGFYKIKKAWMIAKKEANEYLESYERRLFFYKNRSKYKILFSKEDAIFLLIHTIILIFTCYLGRSTYAIFN